MLIPNNGVDYNYYIKLNGQSSGSSAGTYKRWGDTLIVLTGKQYSSYLKGRDKELKKVYNQPNYLKGIYSIQNDVYSSSEQTDYVHVVLRNKESYDSVAAFVMNFSKSIQDVFIDNGMHKAKLSEVLSGRSMYSKYTLNKIHAHTIPITFYNFQGNWVRFYSDFRNREMTSIGRPTLERSGSQHNLQSFSSLPFYNADWEKYMLYKIRTSATKQTYVSLGSIDMNNPDFRGLDKTHLYFHYVFSSYVKYLYDFEKYQRKMTTNFNSFPLQFTLIGDENGMVFKATINNVLSTEEISKVNKYIFVRI
jgi:hypothetical protein